MHALRLMMIMMICIEGGEEYYKIESEATINMMSISVSNDQDASEGGRYRFLPSITCSGCNIKFSIFSLICSPPSASSSPLTHRSGKLNSLQKTRSTPTRMRSGRGRAIVVFDPIGYGPCYIFGSITPG